MKIIKSFFLIPMAMLFVQCASPQPEIMPFQKKAEFIIENDQYKLMLPFLNSASKKYGGFIKKSRKNTDETGYNTAEFTVKVPFKFFYDLMTDIREKYAGQILEENILEEEDNVRIFSAKSNELKLKEQSLENLTSRMCWLSNTEEKIIIKYEIDKIEAEISQLRMERLTMLETLNYSTILIKWQDIPPKKEEPVIEEKPIIQKDTVYLAPEEIIPGIRPPRVIHLENNGTIETFQIGEPIKVIINNQPETDDMDIITKVDLEKETIDIQMVKPQSKPVLTLDHKCQIINVGLGALPEIYIEPDLADEQVIITPRFNKNCEMIGYEIRVGTTQSGCKAGLVNYQRFLQCTAKTRQKGPVRKKASVREELELFYWLPID